MRLLLDVCSKESEAWGKALSLAEVLKEELDIPGVQLALSLVPSPTLEEHSPKGQLLPQEGKLALVLQTVQETDWGTADGFPDGREHSPLMERLYEGQR